MFSFAPPVKVARTQRVSEASKPSPAARPSGLEDAVYQSGTVTLAPSLFLSGAGEHLCWALDENRRFLRVWNLSGLSWRRTEPRLAEIPVFNAAEDGLPLFVCEMGAAEDSLAFCSERGAVSSLDHSVEFQLLDDDESVSVSCFACVRRIDCGEVILTAVGTTDGSVAVNVKQNSERVTLEFNRRTDAEVPLLTPPSVSGTTDRGGRTAERQPTGGRSTLWGSVRSLFSGSRHATESPAVARLEDRARDASGTDQSASSTAGPMDEYYTALLQSDTNADDGLAFTHCVFRKQYPNELVAVNAASEIFLLELAGAHIGYRWCTNVQSVLGRTGYVVAVAETRHKVNVLFLAHPAYSVREGRSIMSAPPALVIASFSSSQGALIHQVTINTIADVVREVAESPRHQVKLFVHDSYTHAVVFARRFCVRVNLQVGVRSPCLSADTGVLEGLAHPLCTVLLEDGSAVTLDVDGPVATWRGLWNQSPPAVLNAQVQRHDPFTSSPLPVELDGSEAEALLSSVVTMADADCGRLTLDAAILQASEDMAVQHSAHNSNWARANLNAEDENIVLHVTRDLRRRQQQHRHFVLALLRKESVVSQLQPDTLAQLLSLQEALLVQVAIRGLQNIGVFASTSTASAAESVLANIARATASMTMAAAGEGAAVWKEGGQTALPGPRLLQTVAQVELCQQILRRATVTVAERIRAQQQPAAERSDRAASPSTAVELVFSGPSHLTTLLRTVGELLLASSRSVSTSNEEKLNRAYATGCIFAVVAQTIVESRESIREAHQVPRAVLPFLWTASEDPSAGIRLAFSHICTALSGALADALVVPELQHSRTRVDEGVGTSTLVSRSASSSTLHDVLGLIGYLLHFSFSTAVLSSSATEGCEAVSAALRQTILRRPFVSEPFGYPFGAPQPIALNLDLNRSAVNVAEALALQFDAASVLLDFALASPTEDPEPEDYTKLQAYCQRNPRVLVYAMEALWKERREWELLRLTKLLPAYTPTADMRDAFLENNAPHLLWLAAPQRFDALMREGSASPPYLAYGPTACTHRSRCISMSKLAWVACGAAASSRYDALVTDAAIVKCQQAFLSPSSDHVVFGLQDLVQRLLTVDDSVEAWARAAAVAARARAPLAEDLLVQVLRRCRSHDGSALLERLSNSVSDRETLDGIRRTAVGSAVAACSTTVDAEALRRICDAALTEREVRLIMSWVAAVRSGEGDY